MKHIGNYANKLAQQWHTNVPIKIIIKNYIIKNNIPQAPQKVGVLQSIIFCHTPDEARSVELVKACVPEKIYSVTEKLSFNIVNQTE